MKATSIDRGMDKEDVEQINNGISLSHLKNEILPFNNVSGGCRGYHTE